MRSIGIVFLTSAALVSAVQAGTAADADVLRQFGILGRLAVDCSAPYSKSNPYVIFAVGADGKATRTLKMASELDATLAIRNLRMVGPNVLQHDETGRYSELTVSTVKQSDGRIRGWRSVRTSGPKKGEVLIADGKLASGADTISFAFCGK